MPGGMVIQTTEAQLPARDAELEQQFAALVTTHRERALRLAWRLVGGDDAAAQDVAQEAFLRAWQGLARFRAGGGVLYDLENLTDEAGRRVAAFGYWAGFAGAALGLKLWAGQQDGAAPPLGPLSAYANKASLFTDVEKALNNRAPSALITGALGRCGKGASDMLKAVGARVTKWDMAETASGGPFPEILQHDVFVNAVLAAPGIPVFVPADAPTTPGRTLTAIADVSCDPGSAYNPIPIYDRSTTFNDPIVEIAAEGAPLAVMAIDHLPSLLPIESSEDFSAQLLPSLMTLDRPDQGVWARAKADFDAAMARL